MHRRHLMTCLPNNSTTIQNNSTPWFDTTGTSWYLIKMMTLTFPLNKMMIQWSYLIILGFDTTVRRERFTHNNSTCFYQNRCLCKKKKCDARVRAFFYFWKEIILIIGCEYIVKHITMPYLYKFIQDTFDKNLWDRVSFHFFLHFV